jgi:hypothetical protein
VNFITERGKKERCSFAFSEFFVLRRTSMNLLWNVAAVEAIKEAQKKKIVAMAQEIKTLSQERCPVDSGTLRDSCQVDIEDTKVTVSYGGSASTYAIRQHEDMSINHPEGQAKFLESAFDEVTNKQS